MEFRAIMNIKQLIINFMLISACITAAMAIMGVIFLPDTKVNYASFFVPFLFAAVSMFPSLAYISRKILSKSQMIWRMILHFFLLEASVLGFAYLLGVLASAGITAALALSVLIIDVVVTALTMVNTGRVATEFNLALKKMQEELEEPPVS